jgi:AbrB family looped-hinge helix DNA binding protein
VAAVKIAVSRQIVIPKKVYDQLKLTPGDYLEVELEGDKLILTPKELVEKRLAEGLADIKRGRVHGPFSSAKDAVRTLRGSRRRGKRG